MTLCLKIAMVALLSCLAIEGSRVNHRRRGSSHGSELFQLESLGRNGPLGAYGPYSSRGHTRSHRRHYRIEDLKQHRYYSEESSETDYRFKAELNEDDSDDDDSNSSEYSDWYKPRHRPCWGWRCHSKHINAPWERPSPSFEETTTTDEPSTETSEHLEIHMFKSFTIEKPTPGPVTTAKPMPALTVPSNTPLLLSRIGQEDETSVSPTTANPEASPTTMTFPEPTTVSQAILDCIEDCVSTPEFNPVCGTNDETYSNIGKLYCAQSCGVNVELRRNTRCFPLLPFADDYDDYDGNNNEGDREGARRNVEGSGDEGDETTDVSSRGGNDGVNNSDNEGADEQSLTSRMDNIPESRRDSFEPSPRSFSEQSNNLSSDQSSLRNVNLSLSSSRESSLLSTIMSPPLNRDVNADVTTLSVQSPPPTELPRFRRTTLLTNLQNCMKLCPVTTNYNPICGTDLVTYINIDRIQCARGCGLEVQILCEQPCHLCNMEKQTPSPSLTMSSTPTQLIPTFPSTSTIKPETIITRRNIDSASTLTVMEQCIQDCPVTEESNPICGTNNVTYKNPVHLLCVQMCGDDVKIARFGACPTETRIETPITTTTTTEQEEDVTLSPAVIECTNQCVVTSEYNPVCGTNEETYTNPGRLECAKFCGIDVEMNYKGFCNGFFFSEFTPKPSGEKVGIIGGQATASWEILRASTLSTRLPLRREQTTLSTTAKIIQSTEAPLVLPLIYSATSTTTSTTPSDPAPTTIASSPIIITTSTTTAAPAVRNFTLPPDLLISIFGDQFLANFTTEITTKQEGYSIDPRFGNEGDNEPERKNNLDPNRIIFPD